MSLKLSVDKTDFIGTVLPPVASNHVNGSHLVVSLASQAALSTDPSLTGADIAARTTAYRQREIDAIFSTYGPEWGEVKDAVQTVQMWSLMYALHLFFVP